jgi:D-alanyl-D-alanine carboxypeptidase
MFILRKVQGYSMKREKVHTVSASRWIILATVFLLLVGVAGCGKDSSTNSLPLTNEQVVEKLQALLDETVAEQPNVHSAVLQVEMPGRNLTFKGAAGLAIPDDSIGMTINTRFRIASVTKMITATCIMLLEKEGWIALDSSIVKYLSTSAIDFDKLHVYNNHSYGRQITVYQLLTHTSGLPDHFFDGPVNADGYTEFMQYILDHPDKQWEPIEMINWDIEYLHPFFAPGKGFHYSDANYVLLGMIIEEVSGTSLPQFYRERIFDPLNMHDTYLQFHESDLPGGILSHPYLGDLDLGPINTSADWGSGGLVSTAGDLSKFIRSFASGEILSNPSTKNQMLDFINTGSGYSYGLGIIKIPFPEGTVWGHVGYYGSFMMYWPSKEITICGTFNQVNVKLETVGRKILQIVR